MTRNLALFSQIFLIALTTGACADSVLHNRIAVPVPPPGMGPAATPEAPMAEEQDDLAKSGDMRLTLDMAPEISDLDPFEILFKGQRKDPFDVAIQEANQSLVFKFEIQNPKKEISDDKTSVHYIAGAKIVFKLMDSTGKKVLAKRTFINDGDLVFHVEEGQDFMNGRLKDTDSKGTRFVLRGIQRDNVPENRPDLAAKHPWSGELLWVDGSDEYSIGKIEGYLSAGTPANAKDDKPARK